MNGSTKLKSGITDKDRYNNFIYSDEQICLDTLIKTKDRCDEKPQQRSQTTITIAKEDLDGESFNIVGQKCL